MSFTSYKEFKPTKQIIWQHHWKDGSKIELTQDARDFILIEYDVEGKPIEYMTVEGYGQSSSIEERYSKKKWKLHDVIQDIKQEYDMEG